MAAPIFFTQPLDGQKRDGDILIKAAFRGQEAAFLLHLESQGQPQASLPKRQQLQPNQALVKVLPEQHAKIMMLTNPFTEQGVARGRREEALNLVLRMLRHRLGSLGPEQEERLNQLSLEQLEGLGEALLDFKSAENLNAWLSRNS